MRAPLIIASIALLTTSCIGSGYMPKTERYQIEMTLHKIRADIEEIKHDLHTHQMELSVIEGKILNNEDALLSLKREGMDVNQGKLEKYQQLTLQLEKKMAKEELKQEEMNQQLRQLYSYTQEAQKALAQYKDKINELERNISLHNQSLSEVIKLKDHIKTMSELALQNQYVEVDGHILQAYHVKSGDSLDKIAKKYKTSSDFLKKVNHLNNDLILAGQELLVPRQGN